MTTLESRSLAYDFVWPVSTGFPAVSWGTIAVSFSRCDWLFPPSAREVWSPLGTVLIINLLGKGLTPRACMGDGGSIWWAPVLYHYVKLRNKMTRRERKEDSKPCVTSVTIILLSKIHLPFAKDQKTLMLSEDYDKTCKVIALSRLSHTNILPSSSSCRPVA